jgi:hypothetical protein
MPRLSLVLIFAAFSFGQISEDAKRPWREAERQIVRLPPTAFPELPRNLVRELQRRGCTIPQAVHGASRNVIKGEFARPGQKDWAVLCSVNGASSILVFWKGSEKNPAQLVPVKDIDYLQGDGGDKIVYSRGILPVGRDQIMEDYKAYGGPTPPPIDHQGIDDAFVGKASQVQYFYEGKWLQLQGGD